MNLNRGLTSSLTSYDFLKFAAIALMIVDHIGNFFYPEEMWWRVLGRFSAPIWFFLIGYARSRDLPLSMWGGMVFLALINFVCGLSLLPVSILGSMLLFRIILDPVMNHLRRDPKSLYPFAAVIFALTILTAPLFEYGSEGFIIVMAGYLCRNREAMNFDRARVAVFLMLTAFAHYFTSTIIFFTDFEMGQKIVTGLGLVALMLMLGQFRPAEYPVLTKKLPVPLTGLLKLGGRWSLEIYVVHLAALHLLALYNGDPGYALFEFRLF